MKLASESNAKKASPPIFGVVGRSRCKGQYEQRACHLRQSQLFALLLDQENDHLTTKRAIAWGSLEKLLVQNVLVVYARFGRGRNLCYQHLARLLMVLASSTWSTPQCEVWRAAHEEVTVSLTMDRSRGIGDVVQTTKLALASFRILPMPFFYGYKSYILCASIYSMGTLLLCRI